MTKVKVSIRFSFKRSNLHLIHIQEDNGEILGKKFDPEIFSTFLHETQFLKVFIIFQFLW